MAEHVNLNGYHCIKSTDPLRVDSARLYIDTNKIGETSSVSNGGAICIENDVYTELYSDGFYVDNTDTKVMIISNNNYYWMNKPENWGSISSVEYTFTPYDSSLNTLQVLVTGPIYIGSAGKWTPPETVDLESLQNSDNILHFKGVHSFRVKTPRDPWAISRIKKGYITDENGTVVDSTYTPGLIGTLNSNSDGYMTYTLGIRA